jgi:phosphatidylserine/phosphatidylglycerophosphate/cardiolipin synthase-like enzyme
VTITGQGIRAGAGAKPYELTGFPFGSAVLPPPHRAQIDQLARRILASWSTARPVRAIRVVGHTDPVGTDRANMALGQRRAEAVRRELLASLERYRRGSSGQLRAQAASRGELDQVPGPAALNRRVQLFFFAAPGPVTTTSGPVKATSPFTLPADPGNCLWPARTATGVQFLSGEGAIKDMVDLLTTQGKRSDAVIYLDNWFLEHDMKIPGGGTLDNLLRSCATKGATIRALVWNAIIPRSLPSRLAKPAWMPAAFWDKIVWDAISRFFPQPKINIDAVDFIKTLPGAMAILDDVTLALGSHHQKILVVANPKQTVAFIGGVEWNSNRLPPPTSEPGTPLFDISVRLDGAAAGDVAELFEQRWCAVAPPGAAAPLLACGLPRRPPVPAGPGGRPGGSATVQIGANYGCGRPLRTIPRQVTGASDLIDNLLSNCRRFFYLECQYGIGNDWLYNSIKQAFAKGAQFGIVVLPPWEIVSDIPEIAFRRHEFWSQFHAQADFNLLVFERLGDSGGPKGPHAYVHSKLVLVDDQAASVGTLNLSRRSWRYDSEATAIITDAPELVRAFRVNLWSQHLTLRSSDDIVNPAAALKLWQAVHAGKRSMPKLRPVHMVGSPPARRSEQTFGSFPLDPTISLKLVIDLALDLVHARIIDPVGPSTCSQAAASGRPVGTAHPRMTSGGLWPWRMSTNAERRAAGQTRA